MHRLSLEANIDKLHLGMMLFRVRCFFINTTAIKISTTENELPVVLVKSERRRRIDFVDLLRLIASLEMIFGHTLDALLVDELRQGTMYDRWSWCRGLTSVAFMLAAGFSFHIATLARFDKHVSNPAAVRRRFRRAFQIIVIGYLLHLPMAMTDMAWQQFQIADVLQCIGFSLLLLEVITLWAKKPDQVVVVAFVLAVLVFVLAPLGERIDPSGSWRFVKNYFTHQGGSLFPLLPWSGYVMLGVVVGRITLPQGVNTGVNLPVYRLLFCTGITILLMLVVERSPWTLVRAGISHNAHPDFNLMKLANVLGIVSVLAAVCIKIKNMPRYMTALAGESLILYVFHIALIYSTSFGLYGLLGHSMVFWPAFWIATGTVALTLSVGLFWHWLKKQRMKIRADNKAGTEI